MKCINAKQQMIFLAEGSLNPKQATPLNDHLQICESCMHVYQQLRQTLEVIETEKHIRVDPWFAGKVVVHLNKLQAGTRSGMPSLKPVFLYLRVIPVAASLAIALWLGMLIGSELSNQHSNKLTNEVLSTSELYDDLIVEDIYDGSLEAFLLTNGEK
jgi:hypothetical protein